MVATISSIPDANTLYAQMDALNQAVAALQTGSTVTNLTVSAPPAPPDDPTKFTLPISVILNPPISDTATIASLIAALQAQEQDICDQLIAAGYEDDMDAARAAAPKSPPFTPPAPFGVVPPPAIPHSEPYTYVPQGTAPSPGENKLTPEPVNP